MNDLHEVVVKVETIYERHAASLQWAIIGVAFILACGIYYWRTTAATEASAWNELAQSDSPEDYAQVASDFSTSKAANWAKLREANTYLETALRESFENREKANSDLKKAREILAGLAKTTGPKELRQQVLFATARCLEMTSDGDLKPAIAAYEALIKEVPDTTFKREAEQRIKTLSSPESKEFYAFFSKQNPKPAAPPKPNDAKAGGKAGLLGEDPFKAITPGLGEIQEKITPLGEGGVPLLSPPKLQEITLPDDGTPEVKPATKSQKVDTSPEAKPAEVPAKKPEVKPAAEPEKKTEAKPADAPTEKKSE